MTQIFPMSFEINWLGICVCFCRKLDTNKRKGKKQTMIENISKASVHTEPLSEWDTPWMLVEYNGERLCEALTINASGELLNAELPGRTIDGVDDIEWTCCDPVRGDKPEFQAWAYRALLLVRRSTQEQRSGVAFTDSDPDALSDEGVALDIAETIRRGKDGGPGAFFKPDHADALERLARWANLNDYQKVSAEEHAAIERCASNIF